MDLRKNEHTLIILIIFFFKKFAIENHHGQRKTVITKQIEGGKTYKIWNFKYVLLVPTRNREK